MAAESLTAGDAQLDGLMLDATTGHWYDPNDIVVAAVDVGMQEPASSFVAVQTRPLRGSPYDRADGRDEADPEGYSAMLLAQSRGAAPVVLGSAAPYGVVARAKSGSPPAGTRPSPPPIPAAKSVVFKAAPATLPRPPPPTHTVEEGPDPLEVFRAQMEADQRELMAQDRLAIDGAFVSEDSSLA